MLKLQSDIKMLLDTLTQGQNAEKQKHKKSKGYKKNLNLWYDI